MDKLQALQSFGLTEAEVKLYLTLLEKNEATANELSELTSTNRTFTYDRLKKLISLGLVSHLNKDNKRYFKASEPTHLLSLLKEREEQIKSILPELEKIKSTIVSGPKVGIFSTKKGVKSALNIVLNTGYEVFIHGSIKQFKEVMEEYFEIWNSRRAKLNIKAKILTDEYIDFDLPNTTLEMLNENEKTSTTTFTFGNYVIIAMWSNSPVAILIESKEIAKNHISFFNSLWDREVRIYEGVDGIKKAWMELVLFKSKELVGFGFSWNLAQLYGRDFSNKWHAMRIKNNIPTRLLSYDDSNSKKYFDVRMIEWKNFKINFLDDVLLGPACVTMSDNLIVTFIYTEEKIKVIVNKNKEMISAYKKHFEKLWDKSKEKKQ